MGEADDCAGVNAMKLQIWHISGNSFHIGRHGLGQEETCERFSSDSLFSAMLACLAVTEGASSVQRWAKPFVDKQPPFVLTSAFPRAGKLCLFPLPLASLNSPASDAEVPHKKLKAIRYVSPRVFQRLLAGSSLADEYMHGELLQHGQVLLDAGEKAQVPREIYNSDDRIVWREERRPRVVVDRVVSKSAIYFTGHTIFAPLCGLWFGVRWLNEDDLSRSSLQSLLLYLGEAGLGGDRSSGFGMASFTETGSIDLPSASEKPWVSLSRYLPARDEISALSGAQAAYSLETVGGWIDSPFNKSERRRSLNMLAEGSVLGGLPCEVPGQMVDVQPNYGGAKPLGHPVWRNGMAVAVTLDITAPRGENDN